MAKIYYPAECPFCEEPQIDGAGDVDGRWKGPNQDVNYKCGGVAHFQYGGGCRNVIYIKVSGCPKAK